MSDLNKGSATRPSDLIEKKQGNFRKIQYQDGPSGEWRTKIVMGRGKFNEAAKQRFVESYRQNANIGAACKAGGVTSATYRRHLAEDPDFAEACLDAEQEYQGRLIAHQQDLVFNGTIKKTYDRMGNLLTEETLYPIPLIQMELRKHDSGYRDRKDVDVNVSGGVLIAPADVGSIDEWEEKYKQKKIIEAEVVEDLSTSDEEQ